VLKADPSSRFWRSRDGRHRQHMRRSTSGTVKRRGLGVAQAPSGSGRAEHPSIAIFYEAAYPFLAGGGERRLYEIARRLAMQGWTVHWFALHHWTGAAVQERDGIVYHGLRGSTRFYGSDGKRSTRQAFAFAWALMFRCRVDLRAYDVALCGSWPLFHLFALMARRVPFRSVMVVDWWETWGRHWFTYLGPSGAVGFIVERILARLVTRTGYAVAISPRGLEQLVAAGARRDRLVYIPSGIDLQSHADVTSETGTVDLVYFGRLKDHKNVDHVLRALRILRDRGRRLTADIIGEGPERASLEVLARELAVADLVTFHGRVDNDRLTALLKRARVFVHPGTKEGGGSITTLEANACGLPIVCYAHPLGIDPGFIREGETGLIVKDVNPAALADGILTMFMLTSERNLHDRCLAHAQSYDWDVIFGQYDALLSRLLPRRTTPSLQP
jgi:glycosyltransferase involved in cell wall biosynthesis